MSVQLLIRDGTPHWYLSPDIWVVPGSDPSGAPGTPVAGHSAYLWAHVANTGTTDATGVRVDFYWANPALQVTRSNATLVGSAYADVPAGGGQDALCLVAWLPVIVNGGHECLVAVADHPSDPLPSPLPDAFDPPTYRQVAQKNLTIVVASAQSQMFALTLSGRQREDKAVIIATEVGGEIEAQTLTRLGLSKLRPARTTSVEVGLHRDHSCLDKNDPIGAQTLELRVARGSAQAVHVAVRAKESLHGEEYQLVRVIERAGEKILGGYGFVVVGERKEKRS